MTENDQAETNRLAERARRIWGDNPFSPEAMRADELNRDIATKTGRVQHRLREMERLNDEENDRER